jgi:hypothetical protein
MEANPTQKSIVKSIQEIMEFWVTSSNIDSLSHYNNILESIQSLEDSYILTGKENAVLTSHLYGIYTLIKNKYTHEIP